jgi:hypothetical protein
MATLQVKNVPRELHDKLAARAKDERTTMSAYTLRVLERDLSLPTMREWLAQHEQRVPIADPTAPGIDMSALMAEVRAEYADDGFDA